MAHITSFDSDVGEKNLKIFKWSYYFTTTGQKVVKELATMDKLGGLTFSASGTTLSITDGTHTWTLEANS